MDRDRLDELFDRYLDRELSRAEETELAKLLAQPECRTHWRRLASLEGKLQEEFLESTPGGVEARKMDASLAESFRTEAARLPLRRQTPRAFRERGPSFGMAGGIAAVLVASVLFLGVFLPSSAEPNLPRRSGSRKPLLQPQSDQGGVDRTAAQAVSGRQDEQSRLEEIAPKHELPARAGGRPRPGESEDGKRPVKVETTSQDIDEVVRKTTTTPESFRPGAGSPVPDQQLPAPPTKGTITSDGSTRVAVALVEEVSGEATHLRPDGKRPLLAGESLLPGKGMETGDGTSRVVLRFVDKTELQVGPNTSVREIKSEKGKRVFVAQGMLRAVIAKQPKEEPLIFATPHGEARVIGTTLRLSVDPDPKRGTRLDVEEGKVEFKNLSGRTVDVSGGGSAVAAQGTDLVVLKGDSSAPVPRPGLALWLRADQGVFVNGATVVQWSDRSGNNRHATQPVPSQQPVLVRNAVGSHPALRFDGVDDHLTFPAPVAGLGGMTIFLVSAALEELADVGNEQHAALTWTETEDASGVILNPSGSKVRFFFGTGQTQKVFVYSRPASIERDFSVTTAQKNGAVALLFVNGQEAFRLEGQGPSIGATEAIGQIGRGYGNLRTDRKFVGQFEGWCYFPGEIAEVIVYTRALGEVERKSVEQYLLGKYLAK